MPFFGHLDLFSEYRRVHFAIDNELWFAHAHRVVTFYIEMGFVALSKILIPANELTFYLPDASKSTATTRDYFLFLQDPYVYRHLFFFKLPYLIFDLGIAALIWRFIDDLKARKIALVLWLFNPLSLYATYIFGRFEVFAIFFIGLSILQLKQHRLFLSALCFGIALNCREIYILLFPYFAIACVDQKDGWVRNFCIVGLIIVMVTTLYWLPNHLITTFGLPDPFLDPDADHNIFNKLFSMEVHWFYPIIFGLSWAAIHTWEMTSKDPAERFVIGAALAFLVFFAFNDTSAHYASWLVLLPILAMQYEKKVVLPFLSLFVVWFVLRLFMTDIGVFTPFLAAPLSLEFPVYGHFPSWFNRTMATSQFTLHHGIQLLRTLMVVVMAFFWYRLVKESSQQ